MSEPLLEKIKEWLINSHLNCIIASEDTLEAPMAFGIGLPKKIGNSSSIQLDVRTGGCETYNASTTPYSLTEKKELRSRNKK